MKILITGFPYVRPSFFATFQAYPRPNELLFLLPVSWKVKRGKIIYRPPSDPRVHTTTTWFHHSHYPLLGGLLKGWMPALPWYLWRFRHEVTLVYSCSEPSLLSTFINGLWVRIFGMRHVVASWENMPFEQKWQGVRGAFKRLVLKCNLALCDGIVAGNQKSHDLYRRCTNKPIRTIPLNGVDPHFFHRLSPPPNRVVGAIDVTDHLVFTFAGAIGRHKGLPVLVRAFTRVIKEIPEARLVIAGNGDYEKELDRDIEHLGIRPYVIRLTWLSHHELKELLNTSDAFVYPSVSYHGWEEQFGYAIAEASLMELPVISTRSGSIEDVVIDGTTGLLIEQNNETALAEAMLKIARDADFRFCLGKAGRSFIINHFSQDIIAKKFYDFFHELA